MSTDGAGNWVVVWSSWDLLGGMPFSDVLVSRSSDAGATWTSPAALNTNSGWNDEPQVSTDGAGNWVAVWSYHSVPLGGMFGSDSDIFVARSTDAGATWTAPAALNTNAATDLEWDYNPRVSTDGAGNWVAAWNSYDTLGATIGSDSDILVARSSDAGATWTSPVALNTNAATDSGDDYAPLVSPDGAGNWVATWDSRDPLGATIGSDYDILVSRSSDAGATWTSPVALNTNAATDVGTDWPPRVSTDGAGMWVAVWFSTDTLGATIGSDSDILVARSTDAGATWTAPVALNTNAATDSGDDWNPEVSPDGAGNWVVIWESDDTLGATIGNDFDILVSRSSDAGATWTAPAVFNTDAATDSRRDGSPQMSTDGAGKWVAVWESYDPLGGTIGNDGDIFYSTSPPQPKVPALSKSALLLLGVLVFFTALWSMRRGEFVKA